MGRLDLNNFRIITKLPPFPSNQKKIINWVKDQIELSLERLGKQKIYGLLLHRSQDLLGLKTTELRDLFIDLKNEGIVQKIGVSIYSPDELDKIYNIIRIDLVQAPLNVIDRRLEKSGWLKKLKNDGVEVHTRSTFLQGLLLIDYDNIPKKFSRWSTLWYRWREALEDFGLSPLQACLSYPLSLEQVDRVIVGVESAKQLKAILSASRIIDCDLDTSFMNSIDKNLINPFNWDQL